MPFELFQDVILTADVPEEGLYIGDIGTVVERHDVPNTPTGYSVEFFDLTGKTVALVCLPETRLRAPTPNDRPTVRTLSSLTR
jgi:hypothetical protein